MIASTVQVAPDGSGKKIQTFTDGVKHAQAVVLVDSSGNPITVGAIDATSNVLQGDGSGNAIASIITAFGTTAAISQSSSGDVGFSVENTDNGAGSRAVTKFQNDASKQAVFGIRSSGAPAFPVVGPNTMFVGTDSPGSSLGIFTYDQPIRFSADDAATAHVTFGTTNATFMLPVVAPNIELGHPTDSTIARVAPGIISVEGVNVILNGGPLGTPSSGNVANCLGLPLAGLNNPAVAGKFLRSNGTNWIASTPTLPTSAGVAGKVLTSDGTNYVESTPTFPNASAITGKFIRSDGTNWIASTPTLPTTAGVAGKILRSDGTNYVDSTPTYPNSGSISGKIIVADGTNFVASTPTFPNASATSGKVIQSDGTNWVASTPTFPATAGVSGKVLRSDGTNYLDSVPTLPVTASAISGKIIQSDGTNWIASTPTYPTTAGTNGNIPVSDGTNWISAARLMQQASGSSTSGTNGTVVARITAGAGNQLVGFTAFVDQTTAASTQTNVNVVYSDGTFTTGNSGPNQPVQIYVNYAGILITQSAQFVSVTALSAKKVTSINITTQNTGVGTRGAIITAEEIPMS